MTTYSISQEICTRFCCVLLSVVMQSFIMNSHEVFIHIHQGCFAGTGAIVRLPQCQWSKPDGYGKISQCITTTKHSKAKTVCIFLGIYCTKHEQPILCVHSVVLKIVVLGVWSKLNNNCGHPTSQILIITSCCSYRANIQVMFNRLPVFWQWWQVGKIQERRKSV